MYLVKKEQIIVYCKYCKMEKIMMMTAIAMLIWSWQCYDVGDNLDDADDYDDVDDDDCVDDYDDVDG